MKKHAFERPRPQRTSLQETSLWFPFPCEPFAPDGTRSKFLPVALAVATLAASALGASATENTASRNRHFDAREQANTHLRVPISSAQGYSEAALRIDVPSLAVTYSGKTGAARSVTNHVGYLTPPKVGDPLTIGIDFVHQHRDLFGLTLADLDDYEITDSVFSQVSGATHIYLRQTHAGLPVYNGQLQLHINRDGRLLSVNNAFLPDLATAIDGPGSQGLGSQPTASLLSAERAVTATANHLDLTLTTPPRAVSSPIGLARKTLIEAGELSTDRIEAHLMWLPIRRGEARLVWNFQLAIPNRDSHLDMTVDADSGKVWTRFDWVSDAQYRVFEQPLADPDHAVPAPPADGRTLAVDPNDLTASPFGWHDTDGSAGAEFTIHRGNNTYAYEDSDGNNSPPAVEPDCGATLDCDFPLDLTMAPATYQPAAITDLFYWSNVIHDVQYQYGFDEVGGNFQVNNYGNGGVGGDAVLAEVQDPGTSCNANFFTSPDGIAPRMQMFPCSISSPARDSSLDHVIVAHEFGHGISNRQVGGPSNTSCLTNAQQPGEGWSDWLGLVYTATSSDKGTDGRGVGTYLFNQPTDGPGVRQQRYSTDPAVNTWTYETIASAGGANGIGAHWTQAIWEVYWALVDTHGFDPNLYDALGGSGNQRAMLYVNEGLKQTACSPTLIDARDGVIQAAMDTYGGSDVCRVWTAFAGFGLGTDASTPGPGSTSATNGFSVPPECSVTPEIFADGFESGNTSAWSLAVP